MAECAYSANIAQKGAWCNNFLGSRIKENVEFQANIVQSPSPSSGQMCYRYRVQVEWRFDTVRQFYIEPPNKLLRKPWIERLVIWSERDAARPEYWNQLPDFQKLLELSPQAINTPRGGHAEIGLSEWIHCHNRKLRPSRTPLQFQNVDRNYFPIDSINQTYFRKSVKHTTCPWKLCGGRRSVSVNSSLVSVI
jgi:hypothetical protein